MEGFRGDQTRDAINLLRVLRKADLPDGPATDAAQDADLVACGAPPGEEVSEAGHGIVGSAVSAPAGGCHQLAEVVFQPKNFLVSGGGIVAVSTGKGVECPARWGQAESIFRTLDATMGIGHPGEGDPHGLDEVERGEVGGGGEAPEKVTQFEFGALHAALFSSKDEGAPCDGPSLAEQGLRDEFDAIDPVVPPVDSGQPDHEFAVGDGLGQRLEYRGGSQELRRAGTEPPRVGAVDLATGRHDAEPPGAQVLDNSRHAAHVAGLLGRYQNDDPGP